MIRMRSRRDKSRDKIKYTKLVDISGDTVDTYHDEQFTDSTPAKIPIRSIALATFLFLVGSVLLVLAGLLVGGVFGDTPDASAMPLLIIGALTFIPGFYHVRLAYYAWKGYYGYSFSDIPSYDD